MNANTANLTVMAPARRILFTHLAILNLFLCGCSERGGRDEEVVFLRAIMPESLVGMSSVDVATRDSLAVIDEGDSQHLGLRVFPAMPKQHGGIRAEVSVDFPFNDGDCVTYRWRFMVAEDFVSDAPENRWWLIGQWHDQPNRASGESWEDFDSLSPPVSLSIGEVDSQLVVGLNYGLTTDGNVQQQVGPTPITKGTWHTIETRIHWTEGMSGQAEVFVDGSEVPVLVASGPNMNNGYQHYLKVGMYRHPDIDTENWIYVDDLEIALDETP